MFRFFEHLLEPTEQPPPVLGSPRALSRFFWHFVRQVPGLLAALFVTGFIVALLDAAIPVFIGRIVTLVTSQSPGAIWQIAGWQLVGMAGLLLVLRPTAHFATALVTNQVLIPGLTNLTRWQSHWHVVRQGWTYFQNDFAGRIANRVMQTGPALRESVVSSINAVWYILVYGTSAALLLGRADWRLALPILCWFVTYAVVLRTFLPSMRERSRRMSEMRSEVTGRVVDSYTNILTVKLFARARDEDDFVRESINAHTVANRRQLRMTTAWGLSLILMNASLLTGTGGLALWLWTRGRVPVGTVAMAIPMAWQIGNIAGWVAQQIANIFDNIGQVQDGMRWTAQPRQMPDAPGPAAPPRGPR